MKKLIVRLLVVVAAFGLPGCGGGGGGGGTGPSNFTINGTVLNSDNSPATNDTVSFDNSNTLKAATDANGKYTLVVPGGQVTGNDNLWVLDASSNVLDVAPIAVNASPLTPTTVLPAPPVPPVGLAKGKH